MIGKRESFVQTLQSLQSVRQSLTVLDLTLLVLTLLVLTFGSLDFELVFALDFVLDLNLRSKTREGREPLHRFS